MALTIKGIRRKNLAYALRNQSLAKEDPNKRCTVVLNHNLILNTRTNFIGAVVKSESLGSERKSG